MNKQHIKTFGKKALKFLVRVIPDDPENRDGMAGIPDIDRIYDGTENEHFYYTSAEPHIRALEKRVTHLEKKLKNLMEN